MLTRLNTARTSLRFWMIVLGGALVAANKVVNFLDEGTLLALLGLLGGGAVADTVRPMGK